LRTKAIVRIDLATVRLRVGELETAAAAVEPALLVPPSQRIDSISMRLSRVRTELSSSRYHGSAQARDLDERIEEFSPDAMESSCDRAMLDQQAPRPTVGYDLQQISHAGLVRGWPGYVNRQTSR
jgi:hypothetical protein